MTLWDIGDYVYDTITGGKQSTDRSAENISKAGEEYKQSMVDLANNQKSAKQLYQEGKEQASASANNKAGLAQRNAKAAAMSTTGSKLLSAIQGAQGAVDASTSGFDTTSSQVAGLQASQEQAKNNLIGAGNQGILNANTTANTLKANQAQQAASDRRKTATAIGSAFIQGLGQ